MWIYRECDGSLLLCRFKPNVNLFEIYEYDDLNEMMHLPTSWFPEVHEMECYEIECRVFSGGKYPVFVARDGSGDCYLHMSEPSRYKYGGFECYVSGNNLLLGKKAFPGVGVLCGAIKFELSLLYPNNTRKIKRLYHG